MRRFEWIGDGSDARPVDESLSDATMRTFAFGQTEAVLAAEPRLRTIATLVERAGPLDEALWREVGVLSAAFIGQGRRVPQMVAVTSETAAVAPVLTGETARLRFVAALRRLAGQVAS